MVIHQLKKLISYFNLRFTATGKFVVFLSVFCGVAGINTVANRMYFLFAICAGFILVAFLSSRKKLHHIDVNVETPDFTTVGEELPVQVTIKNAKKKSYYNIGVGIMDFPESIVLKDKTPVEKYIDYMEPGKDYSFTWLPKCMKRGVYQFRGVVLESMDPFGLTRTIREILYVKRIVVYPKHYPLKRVSIPTNRKFHPGGVSLSSKVGDSVEFFSVREYRAGDDISRICWKSLAKHGNLIVKEFQEEYFVRTALILDTQLPENGQLPGSGEQKLEYAISLVASITDFLAKNDYIIDVFAAGSEVYHITAGRNLAFLEQILEILACIEPTREANFPAVGHWLLTAMRTVTSVMIVLLDWDETRQKLVEQLLEYNFSIKLVVLTHEGYVPSIPLGLDPHVECEYVQVMDAGFVEEI